MSQWQDTGRKPNYVWEMLSSEKNMLIGLVAAAVGGVLALPFGLGVGLMPIVTFLAGDALAALFIPSSPTYRRAVDRRHAEKRRKRLRKHLLTELQKRGDKTPRGRMAAYERIQQRVDSLRRLVEEGRAGIKPADLDRLDDAAVDYLGLWLADAVLLERQKSLSETSVDGKLKQLGVDIIKETNVANRKRLEKAQESLLALKQNSRRIRARQASLDAALLSLPDAVEEIYQAAVANPMGAGSMDSLSEAVDKLRFEEDLDITIEEELSNVRRLKRVVQQTTAAGVAQ